MFYFSFISLLALHKLQFGSHERSTYAVGSVGVQKQPGIKACNRSPKLQSTDEAARTHGALYRRTGAVVAKRQFAVGQRVTVDLTAMCLLGPCSTHTDKRRNSTAAAVAAVENCVNRADRKQ